MDIEIFDGLFTEDFKGNSQPFIKSKGFIILAVAVGVFALYVFFKNRGNREQESYISDTAYYSAGTAASSGTFVDAETIVNEVNSALNEQNSAMNDALNEIRGEMVDLKNDLDSDSEAQDAENALNSGVQSVYTGQIMSADGDNSPTVYYADSDSVINYSEENAALERMAKNSVLYMQTDNEEVKAAAAAENQSIGKSLGLYYNDGAWYKDAALTERAYTSSTDYKKE